MLINFNEMPERTAPGMHLQVKSDDINYVLSDKGKAVCNGVEEELGVDCCHICPLWDAFFEQQKVKYTCPEWGGIISVHDAECGECQYKM